jgi:hypothetical protein
MTSYACEQDYLKDQIYSNKLAVKYLVEKLDMVVVEMMRDHIGTETKVIDILETGIKSLKSESKKMRKRIKQINAIDAGTHSLD